MSSASLSSSSHSQLPTLARWAYGVGHVLNDLTASCWFSFLLVFFRAVLRFPSSSAGLLLLIGQLADGIATPIVGHLSDSTNSRWGKRKSWIGLGSLAVAITFPFIFTERQVLDAKTNFVDLYALAFYAGFIILFQFAWASVQVSHLALVPELTKDTCERVHLNSLRSLFTILSNVAVFTLAWFLIRSGDSSDNLGPSDAASFFRLSIYVVIIGSLFSLFFLIFTPEKPSSESTQKVGGMAWYNWFSRPLFYVTALIYTCTRLLVNISQTYIPLFCLEALHAPKSTIATVPLTIFGFGLVSTIICKSLTKKIGSVLLTMVGCVTTLISVTMLYYLPAEMWHYVYVPAALLGFGTGIVGVSALSLICNLVGENCESGAFVYGSCSFADKVANGSAIMFVEWMAPPLTATSAAVALSSEVYYRNVMLFVPGGAAVVAVSMLTMLWLRAPATGSASQRSTPLLRHKSSRGNSRLASAEKSKTGYGSTDPSQLDESSDSLPRKTPCSGASLSLASLPATSSLSRGSIPPNPCGSSTNGANGFADDHEDLELDEEHEHEKMLSTA